MGEGDAQSLGRLEEGQRNTQAHIDSIWREVSKTADTVNEIRVDMRTLIDLSRRIDKMEGTLAELQGLSARVRGIVAGVMLISTFLGAAGATLAEFAQTMLRVPK